MSMEGGHFHAALHYRWALMAYVLFLPTHQLPFPLLLLWRPFLADGARAAADDACHPAAAVGYSGRSAPLLETRLLLQHQASAGIRPGPGAGRSLRRAGGCAGTHTGSAEACGKEMLLRCCCGQLQPRQLSVGCCCACIAVTQDAIIGWLRALTAHCRTWRVASQALG